MRDAAFLGLAEAARLIETRQLSPVELVEDQLERIEALDPQINAYITVTAELAREQAREAVREIAAGGYRGPLHGIPIAL
jgi:aspartyl-tRNA(Asn)/glutamyl-tRNA(Gln) amidotransferase subunit A